MSILGKYLYQKIIEDKVLKDFGNWELICLGDNHKVYYDKDKGQYMVEFDSGEYCVFDEY